MKVKITKEKKFQPVDLTLTITTIEELRLLYHVLNTACLLDTLKGSEKRYGFDIYSSDIAETFDGDYDCIENEILDQGYKI